MKVLTIQLLQGNISKRPCDLIAEQLYREVFYFSLAVKDVMYLFALPQKISNRSVRANLRKG